MFTIHSGSTLVTPPPSSIIDSGADDYGQGSVRVSVLKGFQEEFHQSLKNSEGAGSHLSISPRMMPTLGWQSRAVAGRWIPDDLDVLLTHLNLKFTRPLDSIVILKVYGLPWWSSG